MSFRNILIKSRCKLSYSLNYMIIRKADSEQKVILDEIKLIMINSLEVSLTSALVNELSKRKIKIIFCNEKCNPECEIVSYQNNYYSYLKIKEQINFNDALKDELWKYVIKEKIMNQAHNLMKNHSDIEADKLFEFENNVENADITNREGHAAKVYFNALFGKDFVRHKADETNKYLDYGYSILLSCISRCIKKLGLLTEFGIHHIGDSNPFNLSCDFIEPLRPMVDSIVKFGDVNDDNFKEVMINILQYKVLFGGKEYFLDNAIELYVQNLVGFLKTGDFEKIEFIKYEL